MPTSCLLTKSIIIILYSSTFSFGSKSHSNLMLLHTPSLSFYKEYVFVSSKSHPNLELLQIPSSLSFYKAVRLRWQQITLQPRLIAKSYHCYINKAVHFRLHQIKFQPRVLANPHHCELGAVCTGTSALLAGEAEGQTPETWRPTR